MLMAFLHRPSFLLCSRSLVGIIQLDFQRDFLRGMVCPMTLSMKLTVVCSLLLITVSPLLMPLRKQKIKVLSSLLQTTTLPMPMEFCLVPISSLTRMQLITPPIISHIAVPELHISWQLICLMSTTHCYHNCSVWQQLPLLPM